MATMLRLQRELLTDAGASLAALKDDRSPEASAARQAIADIRAGVAGDNNALDHADTALRGLSAGTSGGSPFDAVVVATPPPVDPAQLLPSINEKLRNFRQALRDRKPEDALRLQGELLTALPAAEQSAQQDQSDEGKTLRAALADLRKGLDGDTQRLDAAAAVLAKLDVAPAQPADVDFPRLAISLATKLDAFQVAVSANSRDDMLRLQRTILAEADQDSAAIRLDQSPQAKALRDAVEATRAGVSGDLSKLGDARSNLAKIVGEAAPASGASAQPLTDLPRLAAGLEGKVASFQDAVQKNDTPGMLRLQRELLDQTDQADAALKDVHSKPAEAVHSAIAAIRTAFAGDLTKLDEARIQLRSVGGAPGTLAVTTSVAPAAATAAIPPSVSQLRDAAVSLRDALRDHQPPQEIAKRREALAGEVAKAADALRGSTDPRAARLLASLGPVQEAAAGDDAKVDVAVRTVQEALQA